MRKMGLFDKLKKQKEPVEENKQDMPYSIQYHVTKDGKLQVEFYDKKADFKQFYDTTRLVVDTLPKRVANHTIYEALVSYYAHNDPIMIENDRRTNYKNILLLSDNL